MTLEVAASRLVAEGECGVDVAPDARAAQQPPQGAAGQGVVELVPEDRRLAPGQELVPVCPVRERPCSLDVGEAPPGLDVAMLGDPTERERSLLHAEQSLTSVLDGGGPLDLDGLPWRAEALESSRAGVPVEQLRS